MTKIKGIGIDIINNKRIASSLKNRNFINRTYSVKEIKSSINIRDKISYYSKRFAAKESLAKAIGTGFRDGLSFKDIEIHNDRMGKPYFSLNNKIKEFINKKLKVKKFDLFLSISDEKDYSVAFTIIEKKNVR
jgi:holo-[acyl-carrier protein] synthase